jgi:hypothetical protein
MMISDISVRRPVFATVISLLLVILGLASLRGLPVRQYPDIDPPVVSIETTYRGASAEVVETKLTQVIEDRVAGLEGIVKLTSTSRDEQSDIRVEFSLDRNVDEAANDIRDRVSRVVSELPPEADPPQIAKVDNDTQGIMFLNLTSDRLSSLELTDYAERYLLDRFSTVTGVARVRIGGARHQAMRVWLDRQALAARALTVIDVETALRAENVELPAGRLESTAREFTLRTSTGFATPDDFRRLTIGRGAGGQPVRLGEVADVRLGAENERTLSRTNGQPAVSLIIEQLSQANSVEVSRGVRAEVDRLHPDLPPGMAIDVNYDRAEFVEASMREVVVALGFAIALVLVVIALFLGNLRATLVPAVGVPISSDRDLHRDGRPRLHPQHPHAAGPGARRRSGGRRRHHRPGEHLPAHRGWRAALAGGRRRRAGDRLRRDRDHPGAGRGVRAALLHPRRSGTAVQRVRHHPGCRGALLEPGGPDAVAGDVLAHYSAAASNAAASRAGWIGASSSASPRGYRTHPAQPDPASPLAGRGREPSPAWPSPRWPSGCTGCRRSTRRTEDRGVLSRSAMRGTRGREPTSTPTASCSRSMESILARETGQGRHPATATCACGCRRASAPRAEVNSVRRCAAAS